MEKSSEIVEALNTFVKGLEDANARLLSELSTYDLKEQDILHFIEFSKVSKNDAATILKRLKEVRKLKRKVKSECETVRSIIQRLQNSGLINYTRPEKNYTSKVISLDDIIPSKEE